MNFIENALDKSNVRKNKNKKIDSPERKSMHFRVLEETYKAIRKFSIDEQITVQGLVEYFMCSLLDEEPNSLKILENYKKALQREGSFVSSSQEQGNKIIIATAVIVYNHNKGGTYFYNREILNAKYFKSLRQRLMYEIQKSTETAICLMELDELCDKFSVHIDINSDNRFKSSIVLKEAKSYILSQGFECETKPNSWASSCVADKLTKIRPK
jgi:predicted RNase H-related nuclease YkuK (DUF458 family)